MTADNTEPRCQLRWAENRQNRGQRNNFPNGPHKHWSWELPWEILHPYPSHPACLKLSLLNYTVWQHARARLGKAHLPVRAWAWPCAHVCKEHVLSHTDCWHLLPAARIASGVTMPQAGQVHCYCQTTKVTTSHFSELGFCRCSFRANPYILYSQNSFAF